MAWQYRRCSYLYAFVAIVHISPQPVGQGFESPSHFKCGSSAARAAESCGFESHSRYKRDGEVVNAKQCGCFDGKEVHRFSKNGEESKPGLSTSGAIRCHVHWQSDAKQPVEYLQTGAGNAVSVHFDSNNLLSTAVSEVLANCFVKHYSILFPC